MAENNELAFLEQASETGFENMGAGDLKTPLLLISQALSACVADGALPAGHFYNSINGRDYGSELRVVVCHFDKMWYEWKPNQGGLVGRYPVNGLEGVTGDKYVGMKHGENIVEERLVYLVYLPDFPEDGFLVFTSTGGNMKHLKAWNTQMTYLRTPGGRQAPLFSAIWKLSLNKDKNKSGQTYYSCNDGAGKTGIHFDSWVSKDMYDQAILPARQTARQAIAIADMRESEAENAGDSTASAESTDF